MSDLDRFELFLYVAESVSLTQAAANLGMSKASLSKQIVRLEAELKVDLFSRQKQRLVLTEAGTILYGQCTRLKKELDDTRSICHQFMDEPVGNLHVVALYYFAKQLIFPKLKTFLQLYPKLQMLIDTSERVPHFEEEQVDLAVGFSLPAPMDVVRCRMTTNRYVLCASPAYWAERGTPTQLKELKNHYYISHSSRPQKLNLQPGYSLFLKPYLMLNRISSMLECAQQGLGIVQLPYYLVQDSLKRGELIEVLTDYQATGIPVYYYYPKYRYIQPKVRKFIDYFLQK